MALQKDIALQILTFLEQCNQPFHRLVAEINPEVSLEEFEQAEPVYRQHIQLLLEAGYILTTTQNGVKKYYGLTLSGQCFLEELRYPLWKRRCILLWKIIYSSMILLGAFAAILTFLYTIFSHSNP